MSTSNKIQNRKATDPFEVLIFEKGLKIKNVIIDKELDLMLIILNNRFVIKEMLSNYPSLRKATFKNLNKWRLISGGIGVSWKEINEDLSLKGFLKNGAIQETIRLLEGKGALQKIIA